MSKEQSFAHRPPTVGIHLLSDPMPEIIMLSATAREERKSLSTLKRKVAPAKTKKRG